METEFSCHETGTSTATNHNLTISLTFPDSPEPTNRGKIIATIDLPFRSFANVVDKKGRRRPLPLTLEDTCDSSPMKFTDPQGTHQELLSSTQTNTLFSATLNSGGKRLTGELASYLSSTNKSGLNLKGRLQEVSTSEFTLSQGQRASKSRVVQIDHFEDTPYKPSCRRASSPFKDSENNSRAQRSIKSLPQSCKSNVGGSADMIYTQDIQEYSFEESKSQNAQLADFLPPQRRFSSSISPNRLSQTQDLTYLTSSHLRGSPKRPIQKNFIFEGEVKQQPLQGKDLHPISRGRSPVLTPTSLNFHEQFSIDKTSITEFEGSVSGRTIPGDAGEKVSLQPKKDSRSRGATPQLTEENIRVETYPFHTITEESVAEGEETRKSNNLKIVTGLAKQNSKDDTQSTASKERETPAWRTTFGGLPAQQFSNQIFIEDHDLDLNKTGFQSTRTWCKRLDVKILEDDDDFEESDTNDNLGSARAESHFSLAPMQRDENEVEEIPYHSDKTAEISLSHQNAEKVTERNPFENARDQCTFVNQDFSQARKHFATSAVFTTQKKDQKISPTWSYLESPYITPRIGSQDS